MFLWDSELADEYYLKYNFNSKYKMVICSPYFPVRADMRKRFAETHPNRFSMVQCTYYTLGFVKRFLQQNYWKIVFSESFSALCLFMVLAAVITIAGVFGQYQ